MNLNQVTVATTDVARAIGFYSTLGLRLIVESIPRYARFECPDGESTFSIHRPRRSSELTRLLLKKLTQGGTVDTAQNSQKRANRTAACSAWPKPQKCRAFGQLPAYMRLCGVKGTLRRVEKPDSPLTPRRRIAVLARANGGSICEQKGGQFS
jgi:catechol 2,3-dioxygenase-like lactoylglutathione lyase family enzyme